MKLWCWLEGKMAGPAERSLGVKERNKGKQGRWNEQIWEERWKYFFLSLACITSCLYYFLSCTQSLMFNYWKHSSSPSPAKQYPAYISSRHHLTDGNIKIWLGGGVGAESGTAERCGGGRCAWVQLIVTIVKCLVKTATCQETTGREKSTQDKCYSALTLIVPGKRCYFHLQEDIKALFISMKPLRGYGDCCHPQGPGPVPLYYHIKT